MKNIQDIQEEKVRDVLKGVKDPELGSDLVSLNMVKLIEVEGRNVKVIIELTTSGCPLKSKIEGDCIEAIKTVEGVKNVDIQFTSRPVLIKSEMNLKRVKNVIAISSGKGGVGKSTVALNLTRGLVSLGYEVGLLDGDVYGPNIPDLIERYDRPGVTEQNKLVPVECEGFRFISMGLLIGEGQPVIWRGPMLHGVVKQFLGDVEWGGLDFLLIDLPPGTGDVQLSLCQTIDLRGTVVVTTPQKLSVSDVKKGIGMFRQMQVDVLGIVENMSYYEEKSSKEKVYLFGSGGGRQISEEWNIPFLGGIPIDDGICEDSKKGVIYIMPIVEELVSIIEG